MLPETDLDLREEEERPRKRLAVVGRVLGDLHGMVELSPCLLEAALPGEVMPGEGEQREQHVLRQEAQHGRALRAGIAQHAQTPLEVVEGVRHFPVLVVGLTHAAIDGCELEGAAPGVVRGREECQLLDRLLGLTPSRMDGGEPLVHHPARALDVEAGGILPVAGRRGGLHRPQPLEDLLVDLEGSLVGVGALEPLRGGESALDVEVVKPAVARVKRNVLGDPSRALGGHRCAERAREGAMERCARVLPDVPVDLLDEGPVGQDRLGAARSLAHLHEAERLEPAERLDYLFPRGGHLAAGALHRPRSHPPWMPRRR